MNSTLAKSYYYPFGLGFAFSPFAATGSVLGRWSFLGLFFCCYGFVLAFSLNLAKAFCTSSSECGFLTALILLSAYFCNDALMNANIGFILLALCIAAYKMPVRSWFLAVDFMAIAFSFKIFPVIVLDLILIFYSKSFVVGIVRGEKGFQDRLFAMLLALVPMLVPEGFFLGKID